MGVCIHVPHSVAGRNQRREQGLELIHPLHFVDHCLMIAAEDEREKVFHQLWHPSVWSDVHHED